MTPDQLEQYREPLMRYAMKLYNSDLADAEDAVQETFFRACQHIKEMQDNNPKGWLSQILHNIAVTGFRRKRSGWSSGGRRWGGESRAKIGVEISECQFAEDFEAQSREASPAEMADFHVLSGRLDEFFSTLNDIDRRIFKETIENAGQKKTAQDQKKLADEIGIAHGTLRTRLHRLRERCERFLFAPVVQRQETLHSK